MVENEGRAAAEERDLNYFTELEPGLFVPKVNISHRGDEYDEASFGVLRDMQSRHFWYAGRHRFLHHAVSGVLNTLQDERETSLSAIDLGGGCGGWVSYLRQRSPAALGELALADSSIRALGHAREFVGSDLVCYQTDLMNLPWANRWDVAFLLDVLEHLPHPGEALRGIHKSLRPGGYLFVTTPALNLFWSYNDELAHHVQRFSRSDFGRLADESRFELRLSRYFMFFLSPLLLLSRLRRPRHQDWSPLQIEEHIQRTHGTPAEPLNAILKLVFAMETPIGNWIPFPWGTSVLGVFRKPG